jgi:hypothetical protein
MRRSIGRTVAVALLGAILGAAWLLLAYSARPGLRMDFKVTPPPPVSGIYPAERDPDSALTFAWTGELLTIRLPGLDRQGPWHLVMRARGMRPDPTANPDLSIYADGVHLLTTPSASDFADVRVTIPPRGDRRGLTLAIRSSALMVPGPHDRRALGVMLDRLTLSSDDFVLAPPRAIGGVALAAAIAGAGMALLGATAVSSQSAVAVLAAAIALLAVRGFGVYTEYPDLLVRLSAGVWLGVLVIAAAARAFRRQPFTGAATFVLGASGCAIVLKLGMLLHPDMAIGDALFHAHRFHYVLAGKWYFTSLAPGNYSFPYAPGLYLAALPFADLVQRGAQDMALLRTIVVAADALAGGLLYVVLARTGSGPLAGALAVVLYHVVPLEYLVATVGNLTNAFSQSLMVIALAFMAAPLIGAGAAFTAALAAMLAGAFLSHTSTFAIGAVGTLLIAVLFVRSASPDLRRPGANIAVALTFAVVSATLLYYGHFVDTYRSEWARISAETVSAAPDAGGRGVAARFAAVPYYMNNYIAPPVLVLAIWGVAAGARTASPRLIRAIVGWLLACVLFLVIGILTPVDMRHYLAAIPALAAAGGLAAASAWQAGGLRRAGAVLLVGWAVWIGVRTWWNTI